MKAANGMIHLHGCVVTEIQNTEQISQKMISRVESGKLTIEEKLAVLHEENKALMETLIRMTPYLREDPDKIIAEVMDRWDEAFYRDGLRKEAENDRSRESN